MLSGEYLWTLVQSINISFTISLDDMLIDI